VERVRYKGRSRSKSPHLLLKPIPEPLLCLESSSHYLTFSDFESAGHGPTSPYNSYTLFFKLSLNKSLTLSPHLIYCQSPSNHNHHEALRCHPVRHCRLCNGKSRPRGRGRGRPCRFGCRQPASCADGQRYHDQRQACESHHSITTYDPLNLSRRSSMLTYHQKRRLRRLRRPRRPRRRRRQRRQRRRRRRRRLSSLAQHK
jgi:hypothetical protein